MVVNSTESDRPTSLISAAAAPPWSMVAINHKPPVIFPPSNHENLHINIADLEDNATSSDSSSDLESGSDSDSNSNTSSTFSTPWDSLLPSPKASCEVVNRVDSWSEILISKLSYAVRFLWSNIVSPGGVFMTFRSVMVVLAFLYFRQRRRLRLGEESRVRLVGVINERDEKINQLLDQISRMNRVLLELHQVPSTT